MVILENSVTKKYWTRWHKHLVQRLSADRFEVLSIIGKFKIVRIESYKNCVVYAAVVSIKGELKPVAWLSLWRHPEWVAWEVIQLFAHEEFRGQGLAKELYKAAINIDRILLASGKTQSKYSRALWASFVRDSTFNIYAIDYLNFECRSQVTWDTIDQRIESNIDIYKLHHFADKSDVRLVASRK